MVCLLVEGKLMANGAYLSPRDVDAAVFADTGGVEWPFTYEVVEPLRKMLARVGVPMVVLHKPPEREWRRWYEDKKTAYDEAVEEIAAARRAGRTSVAARLENRLRHPKRNGYLVEPPWLKRTWKSIAEKARLGGYHHRLPILEDHEVRRRITMRSNRGECTTHHKVFPIQRYAADVAAERWGLSSAAWAKAVRAGYRSPHRMLVGIAADEASRATPSLEVAFEKVFPLVEVGVTKADEGVILRRHDLGWVRKSGCQSCHFQSTAWYAALSVLYPKRFERIAEYEDRALTRNKGFKIRSRPLREDVARWLRSNPDPDWDAVLDKDYSRCSGF